MTHFLITQRHPEDGTIEQEIYEADTWQSALGMAQLGWCLDPAGAAKLETAIGHLAAEGYTVMIGIVETYQTYDSKTKIQLKPAV